MLKLLFKDHARLDLVKNKKVYSCNFDFHKEEINNKCSQSCQNSGVKPLHNLIAKKQRTITIFTGENFPVPKI